MFFWKNFFFHIYYLQMMEVSDYTQVLNGRYNKKQLRPNHASFFPYPLICVIVGPSGSGKTNLMLNFLMKRGLLDYKDVYIYSKSLNQDTYENLRKYFKEYENAIEVYYRFSNKPHLVRKLKDEYEKLCDFIRAGVGPTDKIAYFLQDDSKVPNPSELDQTKNHILVLDDVMLENQSKMTAYFTRERHGSVSTFYLVQSFYKIPKHDIRENATLFILFNGICNKTLKSFHEEKVINDMNFDEFQSFCEAAWSKKHGFVMINFKADNPGRYLANGKRTIHPKHGQTNK